MTTRARRFLRAAFLGARNVRQAASPEPMVRDHRDLPSPLDILGARFRAARIGFVTRATQTGYGLELRLSKNTAKRLDILERAEMIWLGTR